MICHCYSLSFNLWTCCFRFTSYRAYRWISGFCVCVLICFSSVRLFPTLWTVACKAPLSVDFSRQEYWSGFSMPSSRGSSWPTDHWQADSLQLGPLGKLGFKWGLNFERIIEVLTLQYFFSPLVCHICMSHTYTFILHNFYFFSEIINLDQIFISVCFTFLVKIVPDYHSFHSYLFIRILLWKSLSHVRLFVTPWTI